MGQLIQHYQTSFVVRNDTQPGENKLYQAQYLIGEWVKGHEKKRYVQSNRNTQASFRIDGNFIKRASYRSNNSWCDTNYCKMTDSLAWAMKYTHRDGNVRDVFWVSEIGLRSFNVEYGNNIGSDDLIINVKISYKYGDRFALRGEGFNPSASIPKCVMGLLETFKGSRFYSCGEDVTSGITEAELISNEERAKQVSLYISDESRQLGVALLLGESEDIKKEADILSKNLFGKALVCIIPYRKGIKDYFTQHIKHFNECSFIPSFVVKDPGLRSKLHYFINKPADASLNREAILKAWLGTHVISEDGGVSDLKGVISLQRREAYIRLGEELKRSVPSDKFEKINNELREVKELNQLYEEENKELGDKNRRSEDEKLQLEITAENMKKTIEKQRFDYEATTQSLLRRTSSIDLTLPREYPDSFAALKLFSKFYNHLVFTEGAWKFASEYAEFRDFDVAWKMLHDINCILWSIIFENRGCDIAREFNNKSEFTYARGEGKQTSKANKFVALRTFEFEGKKWEMWPHVKYGNVSGKQLRIHFAIDNEKRRLIVGYIGDHMDNFSTMKRHL